VLVADPYVAMAFIGLGAVGIWCALGVFWTIPPTLFTGSAAAGCIALINAIGNSGGFVGPFMIGFTRAQTGGFSAGLIGLALVLVAGAIAAVLLRRTARPAWAVAG
jgi:ACS family tartrate transporter-like MFS transporter